MSFETSFFPGSPPPPNCAASSLTWFCGEDGQDIYYHDRKFRYEIFQQYPSGMAKDLARSYLSLYKSKDRKSANTNLLNWHKKLGAINYRLATDEELLHETAGCLAKNCGRIAATPDNKDRVIYLLGLLCKKHNVELPDNNEKGIIARLKDAAWWRRQLRKKHRAGLEEIAINLNKVNAKRATYVSDESLKCFESVKHRNQHILAAILATNDIGQTFSLAELASRSVSNPEKRRAEVMVRVYGHEQLARSLGQAGVFYTITCPSRMHAAHKKSGHRNARYDGTTPKQAQVYLNKVWARIRSKLHRQGIRFHGLRIVEPNHDGTPHWHTLFFVDAEHVGALDGAVRHYALQDSPNEPGASQYRVKVEHIDWNRGSAIGYLVKYISKNIDGYKVDDDGHGNSGESTALRIRAWANTWGIRQFQFLGSPPVTIWRELRRLAPEQLPNNLVKTLCCACRANDWHEFMRLMGGAAYCNRSAPLSILRAWSDKPGKYGEPIGYVIQGIEFENVTYTTRLFQWTLQPLKTLSSQVELNKLYAITPIEGFSLLEPYRVQNKPFKDQHERYSVEPIGPPGPLEFYQ